MFEEPTCRICRCEGTPDQPLFHPCKCRGSIKYIHQDCLQSWLEHSKKDTCDICHSRYTFKVVYNENAPDNLPISMILKQMLQVGLQFQYQFLKYFTMFFCGFIEVPFFVSSLDRLLDWQLGCPVPHNSLTLSLLYGKSTPNDDILHNMCLFFTETILHGISISLFYCIVLGSMVLIQSSVVGDEGFIKIINKKIGSEQKINRFLEILRQQQEQQIQNQHQHEQEQLNQQNEMIGDLVGNNEGNEFNEEQRIANVERLRQVLEEANIAAERRRLAQAARRARIQQDFDNEVPNIENMNADVNADANVEGLWDGPKNITFVLQLTLLADLLSIGVLICFKLVPSFLGLIIINIFDSIVVSGASYILKLFKSTSVYVLILIKTSELLKTKRVINLTGLASNNKVLTLTAQFMIRNLVDPFKYAYINSINWQPQSIWSERTIVACVGYAAIGSTFLFIMKNMENRCSQNNPLSGSYRTIYILLLQIISVIKVLTLISVEWALFPLFCGMQIEFSLVPFFNQNLYNFELEASLIGTDIVKYIPKWFLGTFFMYFFASYVGMIRSKILRKGVLFFIRPSDDPNLRLVHDALMKPFGLKMSRIALSGAVYSLYIFIEFTIVTWLIRLLSPVAILPVYNAHFCDRILFSLLFIEGAALEKPICEYWKWVFQYCCSVLRLSSFLLDKDNLKERGHIIYKKWFFRFSNIKPDYSNPILEHEAFKYFEDNPDKRCCFVPDGNYIRAPDDDQVSRQFVRELFVPVTKSDKLLAPIPEIPDDEEKYNPYGDEEPLDITTYTIVYRPPHFKQRLFALFGMLWVFSMAITAGFYIANIFLGKAFVKLIRLELLAGFPTEFYKIDIYSLLFTVLGLGCVVPAYNFFKLQKHAVLEALNNEEGKLGAVLKIIKNNLVILKRRIRDLGNQPVPKFIIKHGLRSYITSAIIHLCFCPVWESYLENRKFTFLIIFEILTLFNLLRIGSPIGIDVDPPKDVCILIGIFTLLRTAVYIYSYNHYSQLEWQALLKNSPSENYLIPGFFALKDAYCIEAMVYFVTWNVFSVVRIARVLVNFWGGINEELKKEYYSSGTILSNVDDCETRSVEDEEESEDQIQALPDNAQEIHA